MFSNNTNNITFLKTNLFKDIIRIMKNSAQKGHIFAIYIGKWQTFPIDQLIV